MGEKQLRKGRRPPEVPIPRILKVRGMVSVFVRECTPDFYFNGEFHDFWEFVCVLEGKAGVAADEKVFLLEAGQIIFHKPMEFHRLWAEGPNVKLAIFSFAADGLEPFEDKVFRLSFDHLESVNRLAALAQDAMEFRHQAFVRRPKDPVAAQMFLNALELFLLGLLRSERISEKRLASRPAEHYTAIVGVLRDNLDKPLTLDQVAALCQMSVGNLKKVFSRYAGCGVIKYFTGMKMKRAISLLAEGVAVAEISRRLGYVSQNYFSEVFKREIGCAPSRYFRFAPEPAAHNTSAG